MSKFLLTLLTSLSIISTAAFAMDERPEEKDTRVTVRQKNTTSPGPTGIYVLTNDLFGALRKFFDSKTFRIICRSNHYFHDLNFSTQTMLRAWKREVNDNTFVGIAQKFKQLTSIDFYGNPDITDKISSDLRNLKILTLCCNSRMTNTGLSGLTSLTSLYIQNNSMITDEGLSDLTRLKELRLERSNIDNEEIMRLTALTTLKLGIHSAISDEGVAPLTNLTYLDLSHDYLRGNSALTDKALVPLTNLRTLILNQYTNRISLEAISRLPSLPNLELHIGKQPPIAAVKAVAVNNVKK